jgi:hypothetical protein
MTTMTMMPMMTSKSEEYLTKNKKLHCDYRTFLKLFGDYHSKVFSNYLSSIKNDEGLIYYDTYYNDAEDKMLSDMKMSVFTWKLDLDLCNISIVPEHIILEDMNVKRKYIKKRTSCEDAY